MKVGFCGSGAWGITLADLIARNGHEVVLWSIEEDVMAELAATHRHPKFPAFEVSSDITYTTDLKEIYEQDVIVECVTAKGFRPVCKALKELGPLNKPFIITSKGIEQQSQELLVEVAYDLFGAVDLVGYLSGPTLAKEVMDRHPTCAVAAGNNDEIIQVIKKLFGGPYFRVYGNHDIMGVALGGAMKNVVAIASGLAEGLGYGHNTKAMLITRGLRELCWLGKVKGADERTLTGIAGMGDLIVTGMSNLSRNFQFGFLLGQGLTAEGAKEKIGMVVEGEYTVASAYKLGQKHHLDLPITYAMYSIVYEGKDPTEALKRVLERETKDELECDLIKT